jgi:mono/diheme cytochrome c family protein
VRPTPPVRRSPTPTASTNPTKPFPLVFNSELLETQPEPGATNALFTFSFTNTSPQSVTLTKVQTSCGCTAAQLPQLPWTIAANEANSFTVSMNISGKRQAVTKKLFLYSDQGYKSLAVRAKIVVSQDPSPDRQRNMQIAATDRQAVFRGDCARCHATPAQGKMGRELFQAVCAVCHLAEHRAEMVPDLRLLRPLPDAEGWRNWITHGKAGTLMPAFAKEEGGPLTKEQIDSIVDWLAPAKRLTPTPPTIP